MGFQSTGSRGARQADPRWGEVRGSFNPRARVEPDTAPLTTRPHGFLFQSTGSRGARRARRNTLVADYTFQSTGSRGARRAGYIRTVGKVLFQSTGSRGARPQSRWQARLPVCFNPRARVEPDCKAAKVGEKGKGFNPRARVEPDPGSKPPRCVYSVSIHGLAWSPTERCGSVDCWLELFQSTGSRGARQ